MNNITMENLNYSYNGHATHFYTFRLSKVTYVEIYNLRFVNNNITCNLGE